MGIGCVSSVLAALIAKFFVDASNALCQSQLRERSTGLPASTPWTWDSGFEAITAYFQPPTEDENFNVVRHERV